MGETRKYPPVKLIMAIALADMERWNEIKDELCELYGEIDHQLPWYPFIHTDYYTNEMGMNLTKCMLSFRELILAERLPDIKLGTNLMEQRLANDGNRSVNLDPGYIAPPRLVLATTKDFAHRIYLEKGIFADLHLEFKAGKFEPKAWTYPDYQEPGVLAFFEEVRSDYLAQLANTEK